MILALTWTIIKQLSLSKRDNNFCLKFLQVRLYCKDRLSPLCEIIREPHFKHIFSHSSNFLFYYCSCCFQFITAPPMVTLVQKVFVGREQNVSLKCEAEGNPTPNISWSPCDVGNPLCNKQYLNISKVQSAHASYTCTARNYLGKDSATTIVRKWRCLYTCSFVVRKFIP